MEEEKERGSGGGQSEPGTAWKEERHRFLMWRQLQQ